VVSAESIGAVSSALDRGAQAADHFRQFLGLRMQLVELGFSNVPNVKGDIKLRANLGAGALGDDKKLVKFGTGTTVEPLCDIRHDRNSRTLNLITKTEIPSKSALSSNPVNVCSQLPSLLPSNQIFKSLYTHNPSDE